MDSLSLDAQTGLSADPDVFIVGGAMDCGHDDGEMDDADVDVTFRAFAGVDPSAPLPPPSDETSPRSILDFDGSGAGSAKKKSPKAAAAPAPQTALAEIPVSFHMPGPAPAPAPADDSATSVAACSPSRARPLLEFPFSPARRPAKSALKPPAARGHGAPPPRRSAASVRFGSMVHFRQIPHIADFAPEEVEALWMMPDDYLRIRATVKSTVSVMTKREKRQLHEHQRRLRQQRQQHHHHHQQQQQQQQQQQDDRGGVSSRKHTLRRHLSAPPTHIPTIREDENDESSTASANSRSSDRSWTSNTSLHRSTCAASASSSDEDDLATTFAHLTFVYEFPGDHSIDPEYCTRGLETRTKIGAKRRSFHKLRTRSAVLNEQELQLDEVDDADEVEHVLDPHYIAMASMEMSLSCRQGARARGIQDARAIQEYVADTREELTSFIGNDTAAIVAECLSEME